MASDDSKKPVWEVSGSGQDSSSTGEGQATTTQRADDVVVLRDDPAAKAAFLATFTPEEEKRIMRKVDRRFLLLIGLMYMVKTVDFNNASSVKVLQVGQPSNILNELHMTSDQYNWVQSIYYISYILFEAPSNLVLKRFTPRLWQTRIVFTWAVVLACHAAIKNRQSFYALRFLLGMFEAGMFPGIMAQLASWYRSDEMAKPVAWLFGIQQVASIVSALLCYVISYMNGIGGMSAWRWVYLLEGLATIAFAGVVFFVLPDYPKSPRSSKWLTPREQDFIETRLSENAPLTHEPAFRKEEVIASLKEPSIWAFMLSQMLVNLGGYALQWYLPTITTSLGFTTLPKNQLLNIPPAAAGVAGVVFSQYFISWAIITRPAYIMIIMAGMVVCFVLFFTISSPGGIYAACVLGTLFYQTYFVPFWSWRSATLKGTTGTAFTLGLQNCVGQVGGVIGPQLFVSKWAYNRYKNSFAIAGSAIIAAFFTNLWTWWLTRNTEYDVMRVARLRRKARREGRIYAEDDVRVFKERQFYSGVLKRKEVDEVAV
ncbi:hypothetical protein VTN96DRAFT_3140 [Rasamsonia emersonii]|uniref:Vitamin H transporter n=1 Tax=Rasamsonia emersonii (strain ATCC 16479 / CBS 393.64 / IMI 116815) TaxID=1408163 RepID=A0A0F4Z2Y1_RASE3|nr:Vitamin H transporter [Rasamsonia emersonii CBS 393.64]KKA24451.1 Vitamin H transporter [Rasamsonia emersonii CBS 393.64]